MRREAMNGRERIANLLLRKPVDRIGIFGNLENHVEPFWQSKGHLLQGESIADHFGFDIQICWSINQVVDIDFTPVAIAVESEHFLTKDSNGATRLRRKNTIGYPEYVDYGVTDRESWESFARPKFTEVNVRRIQANSYRRERRAARNAGRFFCSKGDCILECLYSVCGHEHLLEGLAFDPEWIKDTAEVYTDMFLRCWSMLFEVEGYPDGIWLNETMGFKDRAIMSPAMYRELLQPAHRRLTEWAHERGVSVLMYSGGFIEPLIDDIVEAGVDCLSGLEINNGMDSLRVHARHGDRLSLCGGMDVRPLVANDHEAVLHEVRTKVPVLKQGYGLILHTDHSISNDCEYATYKLFVEEGLRLGTY